MTRTEEDVGRMKTSGANIFFIKKIEILEEFLSTTNTIDMSRLIILNSHRMEYSIVEELSESVNFSSSSHCVTNEN